MPRQPTLVGQSVLIVVDIQKGAFLDRSNAGIPTMPDYFDNMARARRVVDAAHAAEIPVILTSVNHWR